MSIIKSIKQVLGLSGTAGENHFWDGSVPNQLSLKRGTPEAPGPTVLGISNGKVSALQNAQTVQNFGGGTRLVNTDYMNTTDQPIFVGASIQNGTASGYMSIELVVGGIIVTNTISTTSVIDERISCSGVVPVGATYRVNMGGTNTPNLRTWSELRV